jgi:hypothetical protein
MVLGLWIEEAENIIVSKQQLRCVDDTKYLNESNTDKQEVNNVSGECAFGIRTIVIICRSVFDFSVLNPFDTHSHVKVDDDVDVFDIQTPRSNVRRNQTAVTVQFREQRRK